MNIVVIGGVNADYFLTVDRMPEIGETTNAKSLEIFTGGKAANQAAESALLGVKTKFIAQFGMDSPGEMILHDLNSRGVDTSNMVRLKEQTYGNNSIILNSAANAAWDKANPFNEKQKEAIASASLVLIQREVPDFVNIAAAKIAKAHGKKVILDVGGFDDPIDPEIYEYLDIISPNETELRKMISFEPGMENMVSACRAFQKKYPKIDVLLKLGSNGSYYLPVAGEGIKHGVFNDKALPIIDTTGAGDCFTAAFATQYLEEKPIAECLRFASAAAYLSITVKGALPSQPTRKAVEDFLLTHPS